MHLKSFLRVLASVLLASSLQAGQIQEDKDYFPLVAGANYEYSGELGKFYFKILNSKNGRAEYTTLMNGVSGVVRTAGVLRIEAEGITEEQASGSNGKTNKCIKLKFPLKVGTTWSVYIFESTIIYKIVSVNETVKVPAGTFKNCIKVVANDLIAAWYAPGVGLVKGDLRGKLVRVSGVKK